MASFTTKTFTKHDNYMTPKSAWDNIKQYIPKNKIIWKGLQLILFTKKYLSKVLSCYILSFAEEKNTMAQHDKSNTQTLFLKTPNICQIKQCEYWDFANMKLFILVRKSL